MNSIIGGGEEEPILGIVFSFLGNSLGLPRDFHKAWRQLVGCLILGQPISISRFQNLYDSQAGHDSNELTY